MFVLNNCLSHCIQALINLLFKDFSINQFIFSFPLSPISTRVDYPAGGLFSFGELLKMCEFGPEQTNETDLASLTFSDSPNS